MTCEKVTINGPNSKKLAQKKSNWRKWRRKKTNLSVNPDSHVEFGSFQPSFRVGRLIRPYKVLQPLVVSAQF